MSARPTPGQLPPEWGLTAESVFTDPRVVAWRHLPERENAVFEHDGERFHVKRYLRGAARQVSGECRGVSLLGDAGVPTVELVAWGVLPDGRGFTFTRDLGPGWVSGQDYLRQGGYFAELLGPTASLAARLHAAGLCHQDLYLCHFFLRTKGDVSLATTPERGSHGRPPAPGRGWTVDDIEGGWDVRLIDVGRVRRLPAWGGPLRAWLARRWCVKDLGEFLYSLTEFDVPIREADAWFARYEALGGLPGLRSAARKKARRIARHDHRLRKRRPGRAVSLPAHLSATPSAAPGREGGKLTA